MPQEKGNRSDSLGLFNLNVSYCLTTRNNESNLILVENTNQKGDTMKTKSGEDMQVLFNDYYACKAEVEAWEAEDE